MTVPIGVGAKAEGPVGHTYAVVLVGVPEGSDTRKELLACLREIRCSGWIAPAEDGWVPIVMAGAETVAAGRRGVVGVGEAVAGTLATTTLAIRVLDDRQLVVVAWGSGREVARYVSDPSREPGAEEDVLPVPFGTEGAEAVAAACGRPEVAEELDELLGESLDPDEDIESERLGRVLRLLGLPAWVVTAWRLPRKMSAGPALRKLCRLGAGHTGPRGWLAGRAARLGRRWRRPPPVLLDPPKGDGGMDEMAMWL